MNAFAAAQDPPAFRFQSQPLRPLPAVPQPVQAVAGPQVALPALPPVIVRSLRRLGDDRDIPAFLRRQRLRGLSTFDPSETFTLRTPSGAGILAELSLGFQVQLLASDNVNSAVPAQAIADTVFDFTPIAQLQAGGIPRLHAADTREPEYYFDALYAPTEHQLLRGGQSMFLQHLLVRAGRSTGVAHTGARLTYDENLFTVGSDSTPEETFTLLEIGPIVEYRTSVRTTVSFRADYRRITSDQPDGNRTEGTADAGLEYEISPKTRVGTGIEAGHIRFDQEDFGTQDFRQSYVSIAWNATAKVAFRTRIGVEWREFQQQDPRPEKISVVSSATLEWRASETARIAASFAIRNLPSITQAGTLFRETRYGIEAEQNLGYSYYARCEAGYVERAYDTGSRETEFTARPAVGYRIRSGAVLDSMRLEIFYQFRRQWNQGESGGYTRNQGGLQLTVFF